LKEVIFVYDENDLNKLQQFRDIFMSMRQVLSVCGAFSAQYTIDMLVNGFEWGLSEFRPQGRRIFGSPNARLIFDAQPNLTIKN
jgi:hypothetical protein